MMNREQIESARQRLEEYRDSPNSDIKFLRGLAIIALDDLEEAIVIQPDLRLEALFEAAKAICHRCAKDIPLVRQQNQNMGEVYYHRPNRGNNLYVCKANIIRKIM